MSATADLIAMPGVKVITVRRLPLEERRARLRELALAACDMDAEDVTVLLSAWAHDSITGPALKSAWLEYRARLEVAEGVAHGQLDWRAIDDELTCRERTAAAVEIAYQDAEDALDVLAGGAR